MFTSFWLPVLLKKRSSIGMIFSEELVEDLSHCQAEKIEDDMLREILEEERATLVHRIMKVKNTSNWAVRGK